MGFPSEERRRLNRQMWERPQQPIQLPSGIDKDDTWKELKKDK